MKRDSQYIATFVRVEKKYMLTTAQYESILPTILRYMCEDQYGESKICNLYLDTVDDLLVRRSIEKPRYKEKMRLRSYGVPNDDTTVYLEIKKKYAGIVYKRRIALGAAAAMAYLRGEQALELKDQIHREVAAMVSRYGLYPKLYLAYDRVAYQELVPSGDALRITIDARIRSRESEVDLRMGDAGKLLLPGDIRIMEIKTGGAFPLWLCSELSKHKIYPVSFSKYGRIYQNRLRENFAPVHRSVQREPNQIQALKGEICHAHVAV